MRVRSQLPMFGAVLSLALSHCGIPWSNLQRDLSDANADHADDVPRVDANLRDATDGPNDARCVSGASCDTGNACRLGTITCQPGFPACIASDFARMGTPCPGGTCDGAGACTTCTPGASCSALGECVIGVISCADSTPACTAMSNVIIGMPCSIGICDGAGRCVDDLGTPQDTMVTVPAGMTSMRIIAWGAGGGTGQGATRAGCMGGYGGSVDTVVDVTPGETLHVVVGGAGATASGATGGMGGTPGGGGSGGSASGVGGGGGGGYSGVFRATAPLAIAGGGGGGASGSIDSVCPGGYGGGLFGGDVLGTGTTGGNQTAGGASSGGCGATPGDSLQGGQGGGPTCQSGGGGGGGGYFGGGGGAGATGPQESGAGGSGFASGSTITIMAGSPSGPGNASSPLRGTAGDRQRPGRVVLIVPGR